MSEPAISFRSSYFMRGSTPWNLPLSPLDHGYGVKLLTGKNLVEDPERASPNVRIARRIPALTEGFRGLLKKIGIKVEYRV